MFGSNIGSEHFIGLAGAGAAHGIVMILFEWIVSISFFSIIMSYLSLCFTDPYPHLQIPPPSFALRVFPAECIYHMHTELGVI